MIKDCENCVYRSDYKHPKCGNCMVSYCDGEQIGLPSHFKQKPKTNADRIRAMSDEELAEWISNFVYEIDNGEVAYHHEEELWLYWLQQPAEGD